MSKNEKLQFFEEKILPHYAAIVEFLTYASGNIELAYDIAQDTMEDAWKYIKKMQSYENVRAALITIAKNNLIRHRSKYPVWLPLEKESADIIPDDEMTEDIIIETETGEELKKLIASLDEKYERVLILHHYSGLSFLEIAKVTGVKYNTVLSWHARAIKKIKNACNEKQKI